MKLNHECIRDVLFTLEEKIKMTSAGTIEDLYLDAICDSGRMKKYSDSEILYTLQKLKEAGYVFMHETKSTDLTVTYFTKSDGITFAGHQYLDAIRSDTVWKKVTDKLKAVGNSAPLGVVFGLAQKALETYLLA